MKSSLMFAVCLSYLLVLSCSFRKSLASDTVAMGTKIETMLMQPLESGVDQEGSRVPLIVTDDVFGKSGKVVIRKGAPLTALVAWSRREDTFDSILNQPARLTLRLVETKSVDGSVVPLAANSSLDPNETFEFNRANTGVVELSPQLKEVLEDPKNENAIHSLASLVSDGRLDAGTDTPEERMRLIKVCSEFGLTKTSRLLENREAGRLEDILDQARRGSGVFSLSSGGSLLAVDALLEIARFATLASGRLGRMLHGRNIKAYIGTSVTAYVSKDTHIKRPNDLEDEISL